MITDKRLVFDTIPEQFDKWRQHYSPELFKYLISECSLDSTKSVLEIGPGTGQASDFAINAGCDYKNPDSELYAEIQKVYDAHFDSEQPYTCKFDYKAGTAHGFTYLGEHKFFGSRTYTADEYIAYIKTHSDHITLKADKRDAFFSGIREAILRHGGTITFNATYMLDLYRK